MKHVVIETVPFDDPCVRALLAHYSARGGSVVDSDDFVAPKGIFLLASHDGNAVGCGGLRRLDRTCGEIKRLYVKPEARGRGIGGRLLAVLEESASAMSIRHLRLDTDGRDPAAMALFRSRGYQPIADYNGNVWRITGSKGLSRTSHSLSYQQ